MSDPAESASTESRNAAGQDIEKARALLRSVGKAIAEEALRAHCGDRYEEFQLKRGAAIDARMEWFLTNEARQPKGPLSVEQARRIMEGGSFVAWVKSDADRYFAGKTANSA